MNLPSELNPFARQIAKKLFKAYPQFCTGVNARKDGELEVSLPAPKGSHAGHLVVITAEGNIWVRLAPPHAFYAVDDTAELIEIIGGILTDSILFVIVTARKKWLETTLVRREDAVTVDSPAGLVKVISWSGKHDTKFLLRTS
jgi:hypothetical protein